MISMMRTGGVTRREYEMVTDRARRDLRANRVPVKPMAGGSRRVAQQKVAAPRKASKPYRRK